MFYLVFQQLIKMMIIMIVGVVCIRIGLISRAGSKDFSNFLLLVVNSCIILNVYQVDYDAKMARGLFVSFLLSSVSVILSLLIVRLVNLRQKHPDIGLEEYASIYSNCGFIGIPLINSVLGSEGVFYLTAYITVLNVLTWTHGLSLIKGEFNLKNLKEGLSSPMLICTVAGIIFYFARIRFPEILYDSLQYIADMNTPLAMLVAGFSVAGSNIRRLCTNPRIFRISFLKLLLIPLSMLAFLAVVPVNETIAYVVLIASACPTAASTTMMAIRYDGNHVYASEIFSFTTILSVVTIPLIVIAASYVL